METISSKVGSSKGGSNKVITIPKDLIAKLEALPNSTNRRIVFTATEDAILMKYGRDKTALALSKIIGYSETSVLRRIKELKVR